MKLKCWIPVFIWMFFIFWMSTNTFSAAHTSHIIMPLLKFFFASISDAKAHFIHGLIRKFGHVTEYFILWCLTIRALCESSIKTLTFKKLSLSFLIILLFAGSDEFHQSFVPTRTAAAVDVGIDALGGSVAMIAAITWKRFSPH